MNGQNIWHEGVHEELDILMLGDTVQCHQIIPVFINGTKFMKCEAHIYTKYFKVINCTMVALDCMYPFLVLSPSSRLTEAVAVTH